VVAVVGITSQLEGEEMPVSEPGFQGGDRTSLDIPAPEEALVRELQEEVGITPLSATLFDKLEYQFPDRHITLWFWLVENWEGEPWGKEGQPGNWVELQASDAEKFPPANEPVILRLVAQP